MKKFKLRLRKLKRILSKIIKDKQLLGILLLIVAVIIFGFITVGLKNMVLILFGLCIVGLVVKKVMKRKSPNSRIQSKIIKKNNKLVPSL